MSHHTNLAVQTFSKLAIVGKIEDVLQSLYANFFHSPKKTQEFVKMANIMEIGGQRIIKNIKIRWIFMLLLAKRVLSEYRALVLKMH
jgi:hypothetical protein